MGIVAIFLKKDSGIESGKVQSLNGSEGCHTIETSATIKSTLRYSIDGYEDVIIIVWTVGAWTIFAYAMVRVASLVTSAFWIHRRGELFAAKVNDASATLRYDIEYLWAQIKDLVGGPRPWRPFGIRSQLLEVNAMKTKRSGRRLTAIVIGLTRLAWKWQVSACFLSATTITSAIFLTATTPSIVPPLQLVVVLLPAGTIAIVWEARAASGTMGGWAWIYHRRPNRRTTREPQEAHQRKSGWSETQVVVASALIALVTIVQAQLWVLVVESETPLTHMSFWTIVVGPLLTIFGNSGVTAVNSWVGGVANIEIIVIAIAYLLFVVPLARVK